MTHHICKFCGRKINGECNPKGFINKNLKKYKKIKGLLGKIKDEL